MDAMLALGFNLNLGNTPPNIEGGFDISPFILQKSTVLKDSTLIGNQYSDYLLQLSNQDNTTNADGTYPRETAIAISGTLTVNGIANLQFYGVMLDDHGDPDDKLIENNTGRLFVDGDDLSSKQ